MLFAVWSNFAVTLTVFPGVTSKITSCSPSSPLTTTYFTPVTCFLLFNFGDFVGRSVAGSVQLISKRWLVVLSVARVIFIPLFLMCNYIPDERTSAVWFNSDIYPIVFMVFFSFTNGYFASLAMMYGPGLVAQGPEASSAGAMMGFGLGLGLMCGAFMSFAVNAI